jgi:hypothetical protein
MKTKTFLLFFSLSVTLSCTEKEQTQEELTVPGDSLKIVKAFPKKISIDSLKETDFVFALEQKVSTSKNSIYAPTVLLAWDGLKKAYHTSTFFPVKQDKLFRLLNDTKSHLGALDSNEYTLDIEKTGDGVKVRTFFGKSLPFEFDMQTFTDFAFKKDSVKSFGFDYQDWELLKNIQIVYYKNDEEFILKLSPQDKSNEIILVKGDRSSQTFKEALSFYKNKSEQGKADQTNERTKWKTAFMHGDVMRIPNLQFHIEKLYTELMGKKYKDDDNFEHTLILLEQRNAFMLNESGAKMESEAIALDTVAAISADTIAPVLPQPKTLFFNEDFYVFVKKTNAESPYFAIKISNAELMEKIKK